MLAKNSIIGIRRTRVHEIKHHNTQTSLNISSAIILIAGLATSTYVYLTAGNISDTILEYEETKKYIHDLELYGGKTNVLAVELMKWFHGLWHGQSLAYTIACITIFISLGFFLVAYGAPSNVESDDFGKSRWRLPKRKFNS